MGKKIPILKIALISIFYTLFSTVSSVSAVEYTPILEAPDPNNRIAGFLITSINPSEETMTLYYKNPMDARLERMGLLAEPVDFISLYMFWLEPGKNDPDVDARFAENYAEQIKNGEPEPGLHTVLARNNDVDGTDWLEPKQEIEFSIKGSNISSPDFDGRIFHMLSGSRGVIWSRGTTYLTDCINSPEYTPGMNCTLMMRDDGRSVYLPTAKKIAEPEPEPEPTPEPSPTPEPEPITEVIVGTTIIEKTDTTPVIVTTANTPTREKTAISTIEPPKKVEPLAASDNIEIPTAAKKSSKKKVKDDPVWIINLVIFVCSGILLWFFWPKNSKKSKKVQKRG